MRVDGQNAGNFITDRPSAKVHGAPGGGSSLGYLFGGGIKERLVEGVNTHDILIIVGESGSGKTTQLPQFLFSAGFCQDGKVIGITQPRRVAAVTVAKRVAEECGVELGRKVGYSIRFDEKTSSSTRIKYMTDGLLLREALLDPYLSRYSVIIVDEAHERSVHIDVLLGLLKSVQNVRSNFMKDLDNMDDKKSNNRAMKGIGTGTQCTSFLKQCHGRKFPPLKLIIMSASLDARVFSEYFGGARAIHIEGANIKLMYCILFILSQIILMRPWLLYSRLL
ncbi:hypothetical protein GH714_029609 [Hevea brasiliensis]|uniref:RNA helicase n=1 Tax=Hevea brasiliensis TaxID=3981 RepID=A0A6A6L2N3_HEVBR|nr:hypothetical protein GH714_029609 [Hevea brasiliensis]